MKTVDYKRDHLGRVSVHECNRHLPLLRCRVCTNWVYADEPHSLADCEAFIAAVSDAESLVAQELADTREAERLTRESRARRDQEAGNRAC